MTEWILIGVLVGVAMGLTGAGGAIVSVPLFIHLIGLDVHTATTLSLVAVFAGAWFNWSFGRNGTQFKTALTLLAFSLLGSVLFIDLKEIAPDYVIKGLFALTILTSLTIVLRAKPREPQHHKSDRPGRALAKNMLAGTLLGGISTMTGLGGGTLLMPWLMASGLPISKVLPTSLFTTGLVAIGSLTSQLIAHPQKTELLFGVGPLMMAGGILLAASLLSAVTRRLDPARVGVIRKIVFTGIVVGSIAGLISSS